jgi:peptidyl-Lys metalloendopeptidase
MKSNQAFPVIFVAWLVFISSVIFVQKVNAEVQTTQMPEPIRSSTPVFNQCQPDQKASLERALDTAKGLALNSYQVLKNTPESQRGSSTRYQEWYGPYDLSNYETVTAQFKHIYDALATESISLNCDCSEVWLAYAVVNRPYEIHLCTEYWSLSETGTDTQAGILVHEISHFTTVASTKDEVYNHNIARVTAGWTSPATAMINAANYQYYAENDPSLEPQVSSVDLSTNQN